MSGIYTSLAPPEVPSETFSPQSESSGDINVSIRSPVRLHLHTLVHTLFSLSSIQTPPGSARNGNEEGARRNPLNEFLSARDAERPMPMPGSPQAQSSSPRLHPVNLGQGGGPPPLPTASFESPNIGTPIALGNGKFFVPSVFTSTSPAGAATAHNALPDAGSAADMPGGLYTYNSPGMPSTNQRPVIPDPSLLGPADSDSDSDDRVSSGMMSEANTLTTPPAVTRGLPPSGRGGTTSRGRATGKKKRR